MLLLAARTYWTAQDLSSAEKMLRQAIDADPTLLTSYDMLAQLYIRQKKLDQARIEFENLAAKQSKPVGALTMSGMILQAQGRKRSRGEAIRRRTRRRLARRDRGQQPCLDARGVR